MEYRRLLGVFAHPDDELFAAGLLATCAAGGGHVLVVSLTAGEAGRARDTGESGASLAMRRRSELAASCAALGCQARLLDLPDGRVAQVSGDEVIERLAGIINDHRADAVVTFGADGVYGHRDHTACAKLVAAAVARAHAAPTLLRMAFPRGLFARLHKALSGIPGLLDSAVGRGSLGVDPAAASMQVELDAVRDAKRRAVAAHVSQLDQGDVDSFLLPGLVDHMLKSEWYQRESDA